jgi:hypothetical protein
MVELPSEGFSSNPCLYRHPTIGLPPPVPSYQSSLLVSLILCSSCIPPPKEGCLYRLLQHSEEDPISWNQLWSCIEGLHLLRWTQSFIRLSPPWLGRICSWVWWSLFKASVILTSIVLTVHTTRFSFRKLYVLPTHFIYVCCMDLRKNSDYFPVQH